MPLIELFTLDNNYLPFTKIFTVNNYYLPLKKFLSLKVKGTVMEII